MKRCLQRHFFIIPYFVIWVQPYLWKSSVFSQVFVISIPIALASVRRLTRARKKLLLSPSFRSLLKSNMDRHVGKGTGVFNSPLLCVYPCSDYLEATKKEEFKQTACTQPQNYRLLRCSTYRAFKTTEWFSSIRSLVSLLALLQGLRLQLASYCFRLV